MSKDPLSKDPLNKDPGTKTIRSRLNKLRLHRDIKPDLRRKLVHNNDRLFAHIFDTIMDEYCARFTDHKPVTSQLVHDLIALKASDYILLLYDELVNGVAAHNLSLQKKVIH